MRSRTGGWDSKRGSAVLGLVTRRKSGSGCTWFLDRKSLCSGQKHCFSLTGWGSHPFEAEFSFIWKDTFPAFWGVQRAGCSGDKESALHLTGGRWGLRVGSPMARSRGEWEREAQV
jgi:hypothetical protein